MTQVSHAQQRSFHDHPPAREVSLAEARQQVIATAVALRASRAWPFTRLSMLANRRPVLAREMHADRPWPPFRRAMRDGYALRFAEIARPLTCVGEVRAGLMGAPPSCGPGECVAIMTGAAVPDGLDTVVMIEHTSRDGDGRILIHRTEHEGDNIAAIGSDAAAGAAVAASGRSYSTAAIAVAAATGVLDPLVNEPPRVAILASGDELVPMAAAPGPTQIRNSNGPMLADLCRRFGAVVVCEHLVPDDASALERALDSALRHCADLVVFSGGASVGSADLVAPLLARHEVKLAFDAVKVRPGRPVLFGEQGGRLFFGLPGNPLGAMMACLLQVRPAIEILAGLNPEAITPATVSARLDFDYHGKPLPLDVFRPVRLVAAGLSAEIQELPYQGSADLAAAAAADAFLHIPPGVTAMPAGAMAEVALL